MTLGIVGPLLVLFHSNFSLGATNSNVALFCMLAVSGSGLVGRYIYSRVYGDWHEHQSHARGVEGRAPSCCASRATPITLLPGYLAAIEREEQQLFRPAKTPLGALVQPVTMGVRSVLARWRLSNQIRDMVLEAARQSPVLATHGRAIDRQLRRAMPRGAWTPFAACASTAIYVKLFSLWHVAHVPFFIMTLVAGIVHVISVSVY